jgi:hypothetical protein
MDKINNNIKLSIDNYDMNKESFFKKFKNIKFFNFDYNDNYKTMVFYNENKEKIFVYSYELLGRYYNKQNFFQWSWSLIDTNKQLCIISKKILNYGIELIADDGLLKFMLINSRIYIQNSFEKDLIIAYSLYISKIPFILPFYSNQKPIIDKNENEYYEFNTESKSTNKSYNIDYLLLTNILN